METVYEAVEREKHGKTIRNQVARAALETRIAELQEELARAQGNALRISNLESRIRKLRPTRILIGLLFFGLQHDCVQHWMRELLDRTSPSMVPL